MVVSTTPQMLAVEKKSWTELSKQAGVSIDELIELVKLSDLARVPVITGIQAWLYHTSGADTVEKVPAFTLED